MFPSSNNKPQHKPNIHVCTMLSAFASNVQQHRKSKNSHKESGFFPNPTHVIKMKEINRTFF